MSGSELALEPELQARVEITEDTADFK